MLGSNFVGRDVRPERTFGNGSESFFDRLNLELTSEAILAFPHGNSKCEEHVFGVGGGLPGAACLVESVVPLPCFPVFSSL